MRCDFRYLLESSLQELTLGDLRPVTVAVVDSGVDASHSDLMDVVEAQYVLKDGSDKNSVEYAKASDLGNRDVFGHGTSVASIIAQLAPNARIIDIRALDSKGTSSARCLIGGLKLAVDARIPVVNMSLATRSEFAPLLASLCEQAYYQNQVIVAAQWNYPLDDLGFPAELSSCIGVDNTVLARRFELYYHNTRTIEFGCLGEQISAAAAGGGYHRVSGTSFATPQVSGLCALFLGKNPALTQFELKTLLKHHSFAE